MGLRDYYNNWRIIMDEDEEICGQAYEECYA
jgi:hypothetical protein